MCPAEATSEAQYAQRWSLANSCGEICPVILSVEALDYEDEGLVYQYIAFDRSIDQER